MELFYFINKWSVWHNEVKWGNGKINLEYLKNCKIIEFNSRFNGT